MSKLSRVSRIAVLSAVIAASAVEAPRGEGTGTLVYVTYQWPSSYGWAEPDGLTLMHPDGSNQVQLTYGTGDVQPAWSPDGARIAFTRSSDIFVITVADRTQVRLTNDAASDHSPAWSPDGQRIAFVSDRSGLSELYVMNADGTGVAKLTRDVVGMRPAWAPDGSRVAFTCVVDAGNHDICTVTADGASVTRLTAALDRDSDAAWSPDGGTIAFATERYGTIFYTGDGEEWRAAEIALMNPDGSGVRQLRPGMAAEYPSWSPDGSRITFDVMEWFEWWMGPLMNVGLINADGSGAVTWPARGTSAAWRHGGGNLPPLASFTTSCTGHTCTFNGGSSPDPDGSVVSYAWDFGDGATGAGVTASHTYATRTRYTVKLTVADDSGATASVTYVIQLNIPPSAYGQVTCDGVACNFASSSWDTDGTVVAQHWAFGDGTSATGSQASHTYSTPGIYQVTLTVTDNEGATSTQTMSAFASKPPIASFTLTCDKLTCTADASASIDPDGSIARYEWGFGDATYGAGPIVSHTYGSAGLYGVQLIVTDNLGKQASTAKYVMVSPMPAPIASFTSACSNLVCAFDGSASTAPGGSVIDYQWLFGDGSSSLGSAVSHTYAAPGTYTVVLTVRDTFGVPSEQRTSVTVTSTPAHIGDIDGVVTGQGPSWATTVTLTVHSETHAPLANVHVSGLWSNGLNGACVTAADGRCTVQQGGFPKQTRTISFAVTSISSAGGYTPNRNHDADGDSNGTTIVIKR